MGSLVLVLVNLQNHIQSIFCSSFFLCLQGQSELYGSYHPFSSLAVLSSSVSMANLSRLVAAFFSSLAFLSSSISMAKLSQLVAATFSSFALLSSTANLATTFSSLSFLSNSFSSTHFNLLRVARCSFSWFSVSDDLFFSSCSFLVLLLALSFLGPILSLSFLCSLASEALFALSISF